MILKGSGLSSSAAFEDMVGNLLNHFYNDGAVSAIEIAKLAQYAENVHFGKPCGLMDQMACAVGGFVAIDFKDPKNPVVEKLPFDLDAAGLSLCIVNTGRQPCRSERGLCVGSGRYESLRKVTRRGILADTDKKALLARAAEVRETLWRPRFSSLTSFLQRKRARQSAARRPRKSDLAGFLCRCCARRDFPRQSMLQNVYTVKNVNEQGLTVALALAGEVLDGVKGSAYRVHGGGFAGTIQAFVPKKTVPEFIAAEEAVFGKGNVYVLSVRPFGAVALDKIG